MRKIKKFVFFGFVASLILVSLTSCSFIFDQAWNHDDTNIRKEYEKELNLDFYLNNDIYILNSKTGESKIDSSYQLKKFFEDVALKEIKLGYDDKEQFHKSKSLYSFGIEHSLSNFELLEDNNYISLYRYVDRQIETFDIYKLYEISNEDYENLIKLIEYIYKL